MRPGIHEALWRRPEFQFTHPGKGATSSRTGKRRGQLTFQFTHPGKGATPRVGQSTLDLVGFNSRTLGRVRPGSRLWLRSTLRFQFTHPGKGATSADELDALAYDVSIHAPWEGCDIQGRLLHASCLMFQFTHPGKGATTLRRFEDLQIAGFNSRTLGRVRLRVGGSHRRYDKFQFTHPGKGATWKSCCEQHCFSVSIHAPWEGCDATGVAKQSSAVRFNSRTLGRVRLDSL